jgi:hypothetical protein
MLNLTKTKNILVVTILSFSLLLTSPSYAEDDPSETCSSAASLFKEGDIEGALEEARWCVTQLEQLKQNQTSTYFKDEINGYKGGKLQSQQAMGFAMTERPYSKGDKSIKASLTGGASGGANNAFAALASIGMQAAQGKRVRIQRRSAVVSDENGTIKVSVTLKSGGILNFETRSASEKDIVAFAKAFPVADLDDSRK